jgi:cytochrome b subunit of formate dehydrogenase
MSLFRYGRDYDTDAVAQQLLTAGAWLFVALAGAVIAVHLLRRSAGQPVSNAPAVKVAPEARVSRYEIGARLYHWGTAACALGLVLSGVALFAPGALGAAPWLLIHELAAAAFAVALVVHVVVAPRRGEGRTMWFEAADLRDLRVIAANFLGRTRDYPAFGKYDPLQKVFHAWLTVLVAGLIVSGSYLVLSAHAWASFGHGWMRVMRLVHDITAFAFLAAVVVHVYFGVIRVNWPQLVSMWTGRLRGSSFNLYHDAARWRPRE